MGSEMCIRDSPYTDSDTTYTTYASDTAYAFDTYTDDSNPDPDDSNSDPDDSNPHTDANSYTTFWGYNRSISAIRRSSKNSLDGRVLAWREIQKRTQPLERF